MPPTSGAYPPLRVVYRTIPADEGRRAEGVAPYERHSQTHHVGAHRAPALPQCDERR